MSGMAMVCELCGNPKRKLRFKTVRLSICQWCISELSYTLDSPADVLNRARAGFIEKRIAEFEINAAPVILQSVPKPQIKSNVLARIKNVAINNVRSKESFLLAAYRTVVNDKGRIAQENVEEESLRQTIQFGFLRELEQYALDCAELDASQRIRLANLKDKFDSSVEADMSRYLSFRLGTGRTKFKDTRLLRAHAIGILCGEKTYVRRLESSVAKVINTTIRQQDGYKCVVCQRGGAETILHVHHIIPLSQFGTNDEKNLATVCYSCHCKQHPEIDISKIPNGPVYGVSPEL